MLTICLRGTGRDREKVGVTRKVKFWDKPRALELLGKYLKMFTDKFEHTGKNGGPITFKVVDYGNTTPS